MKTTFMAVVLSLVCFGVRGADVVFTGADAEDPRDLARAANWGGTLPGADDVAVVDVAALGADTQLKLSADLTVGGLRIDHNDRNLEIAGEATLTLGADGFVNTVDTMDFQKGVAFRMPVATACAQTWNCGKQNLTTWSTISGTDLLTFVNAAFIIHREAVRYGGKIYYNSPNISSSWQWTTSVRAYSGERWAEEIELKCNGYLVCTNRTSWSTLFGRRYVKTNCDFGLNIRHPENDGNPAKKVPVLDFEAGDVFETSSRSGTSHGYINMTGGNWNSTGELNVGYFNYYYGTWYPYDYPSFFTIAGGTVKAASAFAGHYSTVTTSNSYNFVQTGGDVTLTTALAVGGGNQGSKASWGEYRMEGGNLAIGMSSTANNHGLRIMRCNASQNTSAQQGVYTQTGGTVSTPAIAVGSDVSATGPRGQQFGLFDLKGGTFNLGREGFSVAKYWNDGSPADAAYSFRMSGGTLKAADEFTSACGWSLPRGAGEPFTLDTDGHSVGVVAPVWGDGTLRKDGTGNFVLTDATRFTGTLDVRAGTVEIMGAPTRTASDADYYSWTADTAAAGLEDGAEVTSWPDDIHGVVASPDAKNSSTNYKGGAYKIGNPTVVLDKFNGHAALKFSNAIISVPRETNPLSNNTNLTLALVYQPSVQGSANAPGLYAGALVGGANAYYGDRYALLSPGRSGTAIGGSRRHGGADSNGLQVVPDNAFYSLWNSGVHVAVLSIDGWKVSTMVDGLSTNAVLEGKSIASLFPNLPLHIGGHYPDEINTACSSAYIAEVRAYPHRALNESECAALVAELLVKYDGTDAKVAAQERNELRTRMRATAAGASSLASAVPADVPTDAHWTADSLNAVEDDGAEVLSWPNASGTDGATATKALAGAKAQKGPVLVKNALNGRSVLRFSAADKTALAIPAAAAPTSGATDFTAAVVFRTTVSAATGNGDYGTGVSCGEGLVGSNQGTGAFDFALTWHKEGTAVGCWGQNTTCFTRKPFRLHDGLPHVAVLTRDAAAGTYIWMVDGVPTAGTTTEKNALGTYDVLVGALAKTVDNGFFTGDIADIRLYNRAFSRDELRALSERCAWEYGFQLLGQYGWTAATVPDRGLGVTNIVVAAGACVRMPVSDTAPFTLNPGQIVSGAGLLSGTWRVGTGAELDFASFTGTFEDLRLADGATLRFPGTDGLPVDCTKVTEAAGSVGVDVSALAGAQLRARTTLATFDPALVPSATVFVMEGLPKSSSLAYDAQTGELTLVTMTGTLLLFR
ncbi:MAG: hypothetical protein Q4G65_13065 [bacterium]|nr:hypothetical protein [bacterium]